MIKQEFVERSEIVVAKIVEYFASKGVVPFDLSPDGIGLKSEDNTIFYHAAIWLQSEGIIRSEGVARNGQIYKGVLTAYGYSLMGQPFKIGEETITVGSAVTCVSNGTDSFSKMGDLFGGILGGFTKSMGS